MKCGKIAIVLLALLLGGNALAETTLTLVNIDEGLQDARLARAIELLQADYPDVRVEYAELEYTQVNTVLMAGEGEIDVLEISTAAQETAIEAGALLDLSQDATIVETLKSWNHVQELMTYDGILYGVPCTFWTSVLSESEKLYDFSREISSEALDSWQSFLKAALDFQSGKDANGEPTIWFFGENLRTPVWFDQYISQYDRTEDIRFDTPEFREIAELYREGVQTGKVADLSRGLGENEVLFQSHTVSSPKDMQENYHCLPALGEKRVNVTLPKALSVPVQSNHADIAVELLRRYALAETQMQRPMYYTNAELNSSDYENMAQSERVQIDRGMALFADMKISRLSDRFRKYVTGDLLLQYWDGKLTTDELIRQLQAQLTRMLLG